MAHIIGIIAEFNPLHVGHAYLLNTARELAGPGSAIVVILSGSFVQRGEPAIIDKWHRAAWALSCGADLVVELPTLFALSNASGFATGGVRLASRLGCDTLVCGAEGGNALQYRELARRLSDARPIKDRHAAQTAGWQETTAIERDLPADLAQLLHQPNSLLAIEYAKAIDSCGRPMDLVPILRMSSHNATDLDRANVSASALRATIGKRTDDCSITSLSSCIPPAVFPDFQDTLLMKDYTDYGRYGDLVLYASRMKTADELGHLAAFGEGLENRWKRCTDMATDWPGALVSLKTKRYAYSRLSRMGAYTALGVTQEAMDRAYASGPAYARILAADDMGFRLLKAVKRSSFPIITKPSDAKKLLSQEGQEQFHYDCVATDVQRLCCHCREKRQALQDFTTSPIIQTNRQEP